MRSVIYALFGASFTVVTAWALGALILRKLSLSLDAFEERLFAFIAGSACLSTIVLALGSVRLARKNVFLLLGLVVILAALRPAARHQRAEPFPPLPRTWSWLFTVVFVVLTAVYLVWALAPHMIPDAPTHRLSLMDQAHGFIRNSAPANWSQGFEWLSLFAFALGRRQAVAAVGLSLLVSLALLLVSYGRRLGHAQLGIGAAILTYAGYLATHHDLTAWSSSGNAVVLFALLYVLHLWEQQGSRALLILAGILAGFSYAANYTAIGALPAALAFIAWTVRRKRLPVLPAGQAFFVPALVFTLPWMMKDALLGFQSGIAGAGWLMPVLPFASLALLVVISQLPRLRSLTQSPVVKPYSTRLAKVRWYVWVLIAACCIWFAPYVNRPAFVSDYFRLEQAWEERWPVESQKRGIEGLAPYLCRIGVLRPVRLQVEPGVSFRLDPRDLIGSSILRSGAWQPEIWDSISPVLSQGGVFLDVGAHIGYFSMKAAVRVGKTGHVVAFEPNPETLTLLRENVAANQAENVIVEPIACTDREQMLTLYAAASSNTGASSLARQNADISAQEPPRPYAVRGRPIDDVVRELNLTRVDAIKIDVEGAEVGVLRGTVNTLRRFHPKVVIEVVARQLASFQTTPEDLIAVLQGAGYNRVKPVDPTDFEWTAEDPGSSVGRNGEPRPLR